MPRAKKVNVEASVAPVAEQVKTAPATETKKIPAGFEVAVKFKNRESAENFKYKLRAFGYSDEVSLREIYANEV